MTKLLLIRHGESKANSLGIYTGRQDYPLTDNGRLQAKRTAEYLYSCEKVDIVYASPLCRAFETGRTVSDLFSVPIVCNDGLMEINAGLWESKHFDELLSVFPDTYSVWLNDIGLSEPDGGESVRNVFMRCRATVEKIAAENPDKTVCIATHATPIRTLTAYWSGVPIELLRNIPWVANASVTSVIYESDGSFHDLIPNICAHLSGIQTNLPKTV